jgi:putative tryptophan/tyrosine transport system substrate-binding protein
MSSHQHSFATPLPTLPHKGGGKILIRRRSFIAQIGAAAAWPVLARAQQSNPALIGLLSSRSREEAAAQTAGLLQGLKAFGYVDGQTAKIEYRWADGDYARLPALAKELVALQPAIIITAGPPSARAAKAATSSIPIVFVTGDGVAEGLVPSLARPVGNITGVNIMSGELGGKRLALLTQLVPQAEIVAFLTNPQNRGDAATQDARAAAGTLGRQLVVVAASSEAEIDTSFAELVKSGAKALVVQNDPFFDSRRAQLIALAAQRRIPAIYHIREFTADGGLMSYGSSLSDAYRQAGVQAGRVLKGTGVTDLPVLQPTRFELVINLKTAAALGLTVPPALLAQADEVIE